MYNLKINKMKKEEKKYLIKTIGEAIVIGVICFTLIWLGCALS